jgi:hypothetical protein
MNPGGKRGAPKANARAVLRTFRLPRELDEVLVSDARQSNLTMTDMLISILTKYEQYDRVAQKFGFVAFSRGGFETLLEALPDDTIAAMGSSSAVDVIEFIDFRYKKRDLSSLLGTIRILSKYQRMFDYETSQDESGVTVLMRTPLGEKFVLLMAERWKAVVTAVLGAAPLVKMSKNQVTFRIAKSSTQI